MKGEFLLTYLGELSIERDSYFYIHVIYQKNVARLLIWTGKIY